MTPSGDVTTTFDIRLTRPNRDPAGRPEALHAMEHLAAIFCANHPQMGWPRDIGARWAMTGNYLLLSGDYESRDILPLIKETMEFVAGFEERFRRVTARLQVTGPSMDPKRRAVSHDVS